MANPRGGRNRFSYVPFPVIPSEAEEPAGGRNGSLCSAYAQGRCAAGCRSRLCAAHTHECPRDGGHIPVAARPLGCARGDRGGHRHKKAQRETDTTDSRPWRFLSFRAKPRNLPAAGTRPYARHAANNAVPPDVGAAFARRVRATVHATEGTSSSRPDPSTALGVTEGGPPRPQ